MFLFLFLFLFLRKPFLPLSLLLSFDGGLRQLTALDCQPQDQIITPRPAYTASLIWELR